MKRFEKYEIEFLKINYPIYGSKYCSEKINKSSASINLFCSRNKIRCNTKYISPDKRAINPENFLNPNTEEVAYILGVLWGDGSISKNKKSNSIQLQWNEMDAREIYPKIKLLGKFGICNINRANKDNHTWKNMCSIYFCNKPIYDFLINNDFLKKSLFSPTKILSKIPNKYHNCFWRGFFDADGCLSVNEKTKHYTLSFCGTYEQNWVDLTSMFEKIGVKKISTCKFKSKLSSYSKIVIQRISDIQKLCKYLYDDFEDKKIGLERKYNKFILFKKTTEMAGANKSIRKI